MVLDMTRTQIHDSGEYSVLSSVTSLIEEGTPMDIVIEAGSSVNKVQPSAGGSNSNRFVGLALHSYSTPTTMTYSETVKVPSGSPYTATLSKTPNSPSTLFGAKGSVTGFLAYGSASNSGEYAVSGTTITFNSAQAGETVTVWYQYNLTVIEAQALVGHGQPAKSAAEVLGSIGVIRSGFVYTSRYSPASDWTANLIADVKAIANALLARGGTGASLSGETQVVAAPTADYPYLGLYLAQ